MNVNLTYYSSIVLLNWITNKFQNIPNFQRHCLQYPCEFACAKCIKWKSHNADVVAAVISGLARVKSDEEIAEEGGKDASRRRVDCGLPRCGNLAAKISVAVPMSNKQGTSIL